MLCAPIRIYLVSHRRVGSMLYEKSCYVKITGAVKDLITEAIDVGFTAPRAARRRGVRRRRGASFTEAADGLR